MEPKDIVDIRGKNEEETIDGYRKIMKDTLIMDQIWQETNNPEQALEIYRQVQENKRKEEGNSKDGRSK